MKVGHDSDFLFVMSEAEFKRQIGFAIDEALDGFSKEVIIDHMVTDLLLSSKYWGEVGGGNETPGDI